MVLYASGEDYLEAILVLQRKMGAVRSVDLARHMNFSKPSISNAVGLLKKGGFLEVDGNGSLLLTGLNRRSLILYPTELQAHIYENRRTRGSQLCKNNGQPVKIKQPNFFFLQSVISTSKNPKEKEQVFQFYTITTSKKKKANVYPC